MVGLRYMGWFGAATHFADFLLLLDLLLFDMMLDWEDLVTMDIGKVVALLDVGDFLIVCIFVSYNIFDHLIYQNPPILVHFCLV